MSTPSTERYHAFDLLRGMLMFLGVVLHGAIFFGKGGWGAAWPVRTEAGHGFFNLLVGWIHLFRMPAFFLLAGFFGARLWQRLGAAGFLRHRVQRVLWPLIVAWLVLCPLMAALAAGGAAARNQGGAGFGAAAWQHVISGAWLARANLMHLWFLWYLFLLFVGMWGLLLGARRLPAAWRQRVAAGAAELVVSRYHLIVFIALTALTLRPMRTAAIATGTALWPRWSVLLSYAVFFLVGWLWQRRPGFLATLTRGAGWRLGLGGVLCLVSTIANFGTMATRARPSFALLVVTAAGCWWLLLGLIGIFLRYFSRPWPTGRYLADASYWVYLVHIPVLFVLAPGVRTWPAPAGLVYLVLVGLTFALCLGTYHVFVRHTFVGTFLNGPRRREKPAQAEQGA
jgi:glucan biosynthesis protein C